ncbi:MAG TPA: AI-2E family transporter [Stellaceae bacterium]|nr:AI-2E family transporter [Stellaceae bacterium]
MTSELLPASARPTPMPALRGQRIGRAILAASVIVAGAWVLHAFLAALVWAGIFAIALWPLYRRLVGAAAGRGQEVALPLALTVLVGLVFVVPVVLAAFELARSAHLVVGLVNEARHTGIAVPAWISGLPLVGHPLSGWWRANLSDPASASELLGRINAFLAASARQYGGEVIHRVVLFAFTLLTLFFLFRDGTALNRQLLTVSHKALGPRGEHIGHQMIAAVHGTINGLVLVGLGEGVILGVVYAFVGLPHPVPIAALTGILAVIPFGAPVVFGAAALYLLAQAQIAAAVIVLVSGFLVTFIADHFVRPVLIGGAARLPFLLVLLGILGGLETLGLLGLFVGPAIMAAFVSLWREWTETRVEEEPASRRLPPRRA